jgi:hypothetical protein
VDARIRLTANDDEEGRMCLTLAIMEDAETGSPIGVAAARLTGRGALKLALAILDWLDTEDMPEGERFGPLYTAIETRGVYDGDDA